MRLEGRNAVLKLLDFSLISCLLCSCRSRISQFVTECCILGSVLDLKSWFCSRGFLCDRFWLQPLICFLVLAPDLHSDSAAPLTYIQPDCLHVFASAVVPEEVKPKFVKGTKRYGRRSRPDSKPDAADSEDSPPSRTEATDSSPAGVRRAKLRRSTSLESVEVRQSVYVLCTSDLFPKTPFLFPLMRFSLFLLVLCSSTNTDRKKFSELK